MASDTWGLSWGGSTGSWLASWSQARVTVPDVDDPGTTQAVAIAAIEGVGLVASVLTAYSSTIPADEVISQSPAAGASVAPGSTVTITVSLGEAPVQQQDATGGYWFWDEAERHRRERERRKARQKQIDEETRDIEETQAREIARLLREQEELDAERSELERLQKLADTYAVQKIGLPKDVKVALMNAQEMRTQAALFQLQRELAKALEMEELAVVAFLLLTD